jgi:hypothetical protein
MAVPVATLIAEARGLLQDVTGVRYSATDLVQYLNDALNILSDHLPASFMAYADHVCIAGPRQSFATAGSKGIVAVLEVKGGGAVVENDKDALDAFQPAWRTKVRQGVVSAWMRIPGDRYTFDVYPPAIAGTTLTVQHIAIHPYTAVDSLDERLTAYTNLLVDYMVGMCEAREAEEVGPQRTQLFMTTFVNKVKALK